MSQLLYSARSSQTAQPYLDTATGGGGATTQSSMDGTHLGNGSSGGGGGQQKENGNDIVGDIWMGAPRRGLPGEQNVEIPYRPGLDTPPDWTGSPLARQITRPGGGGGGGGGPAKTTGNAVYDPITQTWSLVDSEGVWTHGVNKADLQAKLADNLKKQYPDWWWGQYASQQDQARRYEVDAGAFDAQKFATMGQQSTRYGPTNF
jgi:hypothetical protein